MISPWKIYYLQFPLQMKEPCFMTPYRLWGRDLFLCRCYSCVDSWPIPPVWRMCCQSIKCLPGLMTYGHLPRMLLPCDGPPVCPQKLIIWLRLCLSQAADIDLTDTFHSSSEVGLGTGNSRYIQLSQVDHRLGAYTFNEALLVLLEHSVTSWGYFIIK